MARTIGSFIGVSKQTEMLIMTVLALWSNIFDMAIFDLGSNLDQVWSVSMDAAKFPEVTQHIVKMILSSVVLIQTFSLHIYIAFLIVMFWPASFATRPTLMLPWLLVSFIKNLAAGLVTFGTGMFTCYTYGAMRPACLRFVASQCVDYAPSLYMWLIGVSYYRDLKKPKQIDKSLLKHNKDTDFDLAVRRRKVKSMADEKILRNEVETRRKYFGTSAGVVEEIFKISPWDNIGRVMSRSLDSLLDALAAEAEFLDLDDFEELEEGLSVPQKTAKLLGISQSEISRTISNKQTRNEQPVYPVKPQKKCTLLSEKLKQESRFKSSFIVNTLLTGTTLYTPTNKPVRPTKSELKSPKELLQMKATTEFIKSLPEREFNRLRPETRTLFLSTNPANVDSIFSQNFSKTVAGEKSSNKFGKESKNHRNETNDSGDIISKTKSTKIPIWIKDSIKEEDSHFGETVIGNTDYNKNKSEDNVDILSEEYVTANEHFENIDAVAPKEAVEDPIKENVDLFGRPMENSEKYENIKKKAKEDMRKRASAKYDKGYKHLFRTKALQVYPKKYSDSAVQASTLSRKILEVPAKVMSDKLSEIHESPERLSSRISTPKSDDSRPKSAKSQKESSYAEIHKNKFDVDKFGPTYKKNIVEDGYSRMFNKQLEQKISGGQLD